MSGTTGARRELWTKEIAASSAFIIVLVSAWLYLAGWTYAYHYFDRFRIPLLMIDVPREHYFMYGTIVLRHNGWWAALILTAVLCLFFLRAWIPAALRRRGTTLAVIATLALFWLGHAWGVGTAHLQFLRQRTTDYAAYPRIQIWLTAEKKEPSSATLSADITEGCYRLLLHNQDRIFLFRSFKEAPAADVATVILPWSEINLVRVLPDNTSCL